MADKYNISFSGSLIKVFVFITIFLLSGEHLTGQNSFKPGEKLKYSIHFGPINAGIADVSLVKAHFDRKEVYHSKVVGRSTGIADKIYQVRDTYESYFDTLTILPLTSIRDIKEGRYRKQNIDAYNHEKNIIYCGNKGEISAPPDIRDITSAFYYMRNYDFKSLKTGDVVEIEILFDDELITFKLHFLGTEHIKTKTGEFSCLKFIPVITENNKNEKTENISPTPKDDMILWLSDDPNHIPIRVKFDLFIGSIKCDLIEHSGLKY
jgi:hypothetical protein